MFVIQYLLVRLDPFVGYQLCEFGGLEWWNGTAEWTTGVECWTGLLNTLLNTLSTFYYVWHCVFRLDIME